MKKIASNILIVLSLYFCNLQLHAQLHPEPSCGQNFNLNWTTSTVSDDYFWPPGQLSNTYTNVDGSGTDVTITFTGETSTLGFWAGQTPKVGTQSSYLFKGIDLLSNGFAGTGITCTITFSKPIYALSFDIHHVNVWETNGDKFTFTGKDTNGNTIYPEFTNSQFPTYTSDNNTGIVNAISNMSSGTNSIVGVNFADPNYVKSVSFLWSDCDTCSPNLPHATGIGNFSFCTPQALGFDGVDDYISREPLLNGKSEITMMSWIKLDNNFNGGEIMGQPNFRLFVDANNKLKAYFKPNTGTEISSPDISQLTLQENLWYHVALSFNTNTGGLTLYLNGTAIWKHEDTDLIGTHIINTAEYSNHDFEIGRNSEFDNNYFKGSINESRVFSKALNLNQLQQQINQKIENNNGNIKGTIVPKNIEGLLWSDLILYYKMDVLDTGFTSDASDSKLDGTLHNMTIYQDNTAPLPYETTLTASGPFTNANNWIHGDVWDIPNNIPEYAIIKINGNLETFTDINTSGLLIEPGGSLTVNQNSGLYNTWYLKLDGKLDLVDQSQLIQTENSTLDITSKGFLEKDLKGTADIYTYNYWSSPVGRIGSTANNSNYSVREIFTDVNFLTSGYNGIASPLSIANYWIWKFSNRLSDTYATWQHVGSNGDILAGEGFTMKGPGTGSITEEQNYTLQGKPNNGDINLTVYAGNDYLVGNPYPSAIDAIKFIQDNKSVDSQDGATNGSLYFWNHWGGGTHIASDYQGGYATFSLSGGVPAASKNTDSYLVSTGGTPTDIPNRYIPSGQGFFTTADSNGLIKFKNSQRVFQIKEGVNSGAHKTNSHSKNLVSKSSNDTRMKIRLGFNSVNTLRRQLLITVDENATSNYDWGYDSKYIDTQVDDMYWLINNEKYTIQGIDKIDNETTIPLGLHTNKDGFNSIAIDELENIPADKHIYLHDKELNIYHDLTQSKYETNIPAGQYLNRFELTFAKNQTLGTEENENKQIEVYFSNEKHSIVINNPASELIETVEMFNIIGQTLFKFQIKSSSNYFEYKANQIEAGSYILNIETEYGTISKKVLIK
jgi:hypothetical protein